MRGVLLLLALILVTLFIFGLAPQSAGAQEYPGLPGFVPPFDPNHPLIVVPGGAATTVQLPTFSFFTISTTVSVPDSGGAFLGGVGRRGTGSRTNGPPGFGNRSTASSIGGGGVSVGAQIIDLRAMDKQLLAEAAADREGAARYEATQQWAARMEHARQSTAGRPTMSVAEARRRAASR